MPQSVHHLSEHVFTISPVYTSLSTGGEGSAACISHAAHPSRFTELAASIARVIATVSTETRVTRVIRSMTCSL